MKSPARRSLIVLAICGVCTLAAVGLWRHGFVPFQQMEFFAQDWQTRLGPKTPMDDRLVLIGVGGIETADDAWERITAGASLLQGYTGFVYGGGMWARDIHDGIAARLHAGGFESLSAAVGSGADPRRV